MTSGIYQMHVYMFYFDQGFRVVRIRNENGHSAKGGVFGSDSTKKEKKKERHL